jgi:hypothetical protein
MSTRAFARSEPRHDHDALLMARPRTEMNRLDRARRRSGWLVNLLLLVLILGVLALAILVWRQRQRMEVGSPPDRARSGTGITRRYPRPAMGFAIAVFSRADIV